MQQSEAYLRITRSSGLPILGESEAIPFIGQVELETWSWELSSLEEELRVGKEKNSDGQKQHDKDLAERNEMTKASYYKRKLDESEKEQRATYASAVSELTTKTKGFADLPKREREQRIAHTMEKLRSNDKLSKELAEATSKTEATQQQKYEEMDKRGDRSLTMRFSKSVDFASAQMLNCMKAGEVFPSAIITVFHRSVNSPLTLAINLTRMRLTDYDLSVDANETLTDMKETWGAEFEAFDYLYQNRPPHGMPTAITQAPAVLATQGKIIPFIMKPRDRFF